MKRVGRVVAAVLEAMRGAVRAGVSTGELDDVAASIMRAHGARSAPQLVYDFPGWTCISVNEQIVHGIPGLRVLRPGDVVKLDVTAELDGFIADAAVTVLVPPVNPVARRLRRCAQRALVAGLEAARPGHRVSEIGRAIEREARRDGFGVLRELTGHGVGRTIHEAPQVPNFDDTSERAVLHEGLVIAVEPLLSATPTHVVEEIDGWTLRTGDHSVAVHQEHTIVVQDGPPLVLTAA